ncbi:hypothetical protein BROUX41_001426 [Berkeleyomyces rouxiae]|uniref:uncharacterized protein n=1 Tax=Berkeleyomyces rouxiae TaxID=2035830 RepID=UPI003B80C85E
MDITSKNPIEAATSRENLTRPSPNTDTLGLSGLAIRPKRGFSEYINDTDEGNFGAILSTALIASSTHGNTKSCHSVSSLKTKLFSLPVPENYAVASTASSAFKFSAESSFVFSTRKPFKYTLDDSLSSLTSGSSSTQNPKSSSDSTKSDANTHLEVSSTSTFVELDASPSLDATGRSAKRRFSQYLRENTSSGIQSTTFSPSNKETCEHKVVGHVEASPLGQLLEKSSNIWTQAGMLMSTSPTANNIVSALDGIRVLTDIVANDNVYNSFLKATQIDFREVLKLIGLVSRMIK